MDHLLLPTIERFGKKGAAQFSNWKPSLFQDYCHATMPGFMRLSADPSMHSVATAFAELLCEGIGRGYVATSLNDNPANLMEYCLRGWFMQRLSQGSSEQRLQFLADAWNLLEGLLREPHWVNAYVLARVRELENNGNLQAFLTRVLKPLFEPASSANWSGPFRVSMLSLRSADDEFLPGDMHLVAPNVLAVRDRRRNVSVGVVLRKQGQSELAGLFEASSPYVEQPAAMVPRWQGESLSFGKERIQLKFLTEPFRWLQMQAGYLVASAVNSQKLWIVESAT